MSRTKRVLLYLMALFYVAAGVNHFANPDFYVAITVYPANIHVALNNVPLPGRSEGAGIWNWIRLPFQFVLMAWAWWYTRADEG